MDQFKQDLTSGNVTRQMIKFSIPLLLSNVVQAIYSVTDLFIVGKFVGSYGISGVGIGTQVTMVVSSLIIGFAAGATVLIAQYMGAKREKDLSETVATVLTSFTLIGIVATVIMLFASGPLLRLINVPEESFGYAKDYVDICMGGLLFIFLYNGISAVMRGIGDSKRPLYFVLIAAGINVVLDLLFVAGFNMEAAGAALATIIAQAVSVILSAIYLYKRDFMFDFRLKSFKIHAAKLKEVVRIGLPTAVQQTLVSISFLFQTSIINLYGVHASSAANVAAKIGMFAIMPTLAMSAAVSAMVGQNVGAKRFDRALHTLKVGVAISVAIAIVVIGLTQLFPAEVLSFFTDDPQDLLLGVPYLRLLTFDWLAAAFMINMNGLIIGSGHSLRALFNALLANVVLRVPLAYLFALGFDLGIQGVPIANITAPALTSFVALWFIASGRWKSDKGRRIILLDVDD